MLCASSSLTKKKKKKYKFYFNFQLFKTCSRLTKISTNIDVIPQACSHLDHKSPHPRSECRWLGPPATSLTVAADRHTNHTAGAQRSGYSSEVGLLRWPQTCQITFTRNQSRLSNRHLTKIKLKQSRAQGLGSLLPLPSSQQFLLPVQKSNSLQIFLIACF